MTTTTHPHNLEAFINGELSEEENEIILTHVSTCNECLAKVDQQWTMSAIDAIGETLEPDSSTLRRLERRVINRIHRSDLFGQTIWLGTVGFVNAILKVIEPLFNYRSAGLKGIRRD